MPSSSKRFSGRGHPSSLVSTQQPISCLLPPSLPAPLPGPCKLFATTRRRYSQSLMPGHLVRAGPMHLISSGSDAISRSSPLLHKRRAVATLELSVGSRGNRMVGCHLRPEVGWSAHDKDDLQTTMHVARPQRWFAAIFFFASGQCRALFVNLPGFFRLFCAANISQSLCWSCSMRKTWSPRCSRCVPWSMSSPFRIAFWRNARTSSWYSAIAWKLCSVW